MQLGPSKLAPEVRKKRRRRRSAREKEEKGRDEEEVSFGRRAWINSCRFKKETKEKIKTLKSIPRPEVDKDARPPAEKAEEKKQKKKQGGGPRREGEDRTNEMCYEKDIALPAEVLQSNQSHPY